MVREWSLILVAWLCVVVAVAVVCCYCLSCMDPPRKGHDEMLVLFMVCTRIPFILLYICLCYVSLGFLCLH